MFSTRTSGKAQSLKLMNDLGCQTNIDVINRHVSLRGRFVIDAGCGAMAFTRQLVEQGARVLAVDPDPVQAELNRATMPIDNLEFVETGAEQLPVAAGSVDGVFFAYSLHHIPAQLFPQVFSEVIRVLAPNGFLYVIEPLACPWNDVMKLFHNEDRERMIAWQALETLAVPAFQSAQVVKYHNFSQYESWEEFVRQFVNRSFNTIYTEADVRRLEVKEAFERLGGPEHRFMSPKQVMILQGLKTDRRETISASVR
jgi:ubiquinone/menaquinone biosynthesis C-methylase UbiE